MKLHESSAITPDPARKIPRRAALETLGKAWAAAFCLPLLGCEEKKTVVLNLDSRVASAVAKLEKAFLDSADVRHFNSRAHLAAGSVISDCSIDCMKSKYRHFVDTTTPHFESASELAVAAAISKKPLEEVNQAYMKFGPTVDHFHARSILAAASVVTGFPTETMLNLYKSVSATEHFVSRSLIAACSAAVNRPVETIEALYLGITSTKSFESASRLACAAATTGRPLAEVETVYQSLVPKYGQYSYVTTSILASTALSMACRLQPEAGA